MSCRVLCFKHTYVILRNSGQLSRMNKNNRENYCTLKYDACGVVYIQTRKRNQLSLIIGYTTLFLTSAFYCEASLCVYQNARLHFPEAYSLHNYRRHYLKSHTQTLLAGTSYVTEKLNSSCIVRPSFFYPFQRSCLRISGGISVFLN